MNEMAAAKLALVWTSVASAWAFGLFGYDKWRAGRGGRRVSESALLWVSALGGWPGGLLGLMVFRHKSAKGSFQLKFAAAGLSWAVLLWVACSFQPGR